MFDSLRKKLGSLIGKIEKVEEEKVEEKKEETQQFIPRDEKEERIDKKEEDRTDEREEERKEEPKVELTRVTQIKHVLATG